MSENVYITRSLAVESNIVCAGEIYASNLKPFWLAGKVSADGGLITSRGRYAFACTKIDTGRYTISPPTDHPFLTPDYIVQLTCQLDLLNGSARVASGTTTTGFTLTTYVGGTVADCAFYFTVVA